MNLKRNKMPLRKIKPGEEFALHTSVYMYFISADGKSIELKKVRNIGEKQVKKGFIPPTLDDVKAYVKEKGYLEEIAIKAFNSYEASEPPWHDSRGNAVIMWKQKILNNWLKDEYKIKESTTNNNIPDHMKGMVM